MVPRAPLALPSAQYTVCLSPPDPPTHPTPSPSRELVVKDAEQAYGKVIRMLGQGRLEAVRV